MIWDVNLYSQAPCSRGTCSFYPER